MIIAAAIATGLAAVAGAGLTAIWLAPSLRAVSLTAAALFISLLIFVTTRHIQVVQGRRSRKWPDPSQVTHRAALRDDFYLFVLGSGGHTKEMLMMMDDGSCDFAGFHRRYLISSGDGMSDNHLEDYEAELRRLCGTKGCEPGTFDKRVVTRARRVHQPLWTTPLSAALSILGIFPALLSPPPPLRGQEGRGGPPRYPSQIFSNGPATGFFVALAVHVLKVFRVVPEDCMRFVYIESWARISTLSLTGKLLRFTEMADLFLVQHREVGDKYGWTYAGEMVFNARRPDL